MKAGMLFSPVFVHPEPRRTSLQTASPARFASPRLLQPSSSSPLEASKFNACNLFRCNTYEPSRKCGKQKTYRKPKSFRCNTYKKHGGGGAVMANQTRASFNPHDTLQSRSSAWDRSPWIFAASLRPTWRFSSPARRRRDSARTKFARARCPRRPKPRSLPAHTSGSLPPPPLARSEEHTSELQSPCNLVCRLLLEKKKKTKIHLPNIKKKKKK